MSIIIPVICEAGEAAALRGTKFATLAHPMGFCFNPYRPGSVEHWNFASGIVSVHFGNDAKPGAESRWVQP